VATSLRRRFVATVSGRSKTNTKEKRTLRSADFFGTNTCDCAKSSYRSCATVWKCSACSQLIFSPRHNTLQFRHLDGFQSQYRETEFLNEMFALTDGNTKISINALPTQSEENTWGNKS
jgi:hypothetical protein